MFTNLIIKNRVKIHVENLDLKSKFSINIPSLPMNTAEVIEKFFSFLGLSLVKKKIKYGFTKNS